MSYDYILVRYGEIALKGKNRTFFEERLAQNIRNVYRGYTNIKVRRTFGRIYIELNDYPYEQITEKLMSVFGIVSFSPVRGVEPVLEEIKNESLTQVRAKGKQDLTFKVVCKRADKNFPITSPDLTQILGAHLLINTNNLKVDLHNPELTIYVEVRAEGVFIYSEIIKGIGGMPAGASGKAVALLSGGIDSPVACWLAMRRGVELEGLHFHSYPVTSLESIQKVVDLAKELAKFTGSFRLHLIPFLELQTEIRRFVPESYNITIMRRIFMRLAETIANRQRAYAVVTGESLGQVASQTLYSMNTINAVTNLPILRPLIAMDKQEIIAIAREINTYEIAIRPFEDCCTIFMPRNPATKPTIHLAERYERFMAMNELIEDTVANTKILDITPESEFDLASLVK
jgi:thiamine biosynthesis protein ThiI